MSEEWRSVVGYEGHYEVSGLGRVRSLDRRTRGKILLTKTKRYHKVLLSKDGNKKSFRVHELVLNAFVGPRPNGCEACHWDDNKDDNSISNLRWDTSRSNKLDRERNGRGGSRQVKRSDGKVFDTVTEAAQLSNTDRSVISKVCQGKLKTAGGYKWEYISV